MNKEEKALKLADLMGWKIEIDDEGIAYTDTTLLQPYADSETGKAQFASILLKFPEVMNMNPKEGYFGGIDHLFEPTQANILDEVLRLNGVEI